MDSQTPKKRGRETEDLAHYIYVQEPKRFHVEETDRFLDLVQLNKTLADEEEEECTPSEELVSRVMRNLMEESDAIGCSSYLTSNSVDNSAGTDICRDREGQTLDLGTGVDLSFIRDASNDDLGTPPSPALELSAVLSENPDLKSFGENWHFEDDFESYQQLIALYASARNENRPQDYMNREFIISGMLFDNDFSEPWRPETACDF